MSDCRHVDNASVIERQRGCSDAVGPDLSICTIAFECNVARLSQLTGQAGARILRQARGAAGASGTSDPSLAKEHLQLRQVVAAVGQAHEQ